MRLLGGYARKRNEMDPISYVSDQADDSGPRCTAFIEAENVIPEVDTLTGDLFS